MAEEDRPISSSMGVETDLMRDRIEDYVHEVIADEQIGASPEERARRAATLAIELFDFIDSLDHLATGGMGERPVQDFAHEGRVFARGFTDQLPSAD